MNITDLKTWVNNLPEDIMELPVVLRDIQEDEGKFSYKDSPIASIMVDQQSNRLCFHTHETQKNIDKIRSSREEKKTDESTETLPE
jgi:hypothetical protein